jgi:hypothetical protein
LPHTALYPITHFSLSWLLTSICSLPTPRDGHSPHIASTVTAHSLLLEMATLLTLPSTRSLPTPGDSPLSSHCPLFAHSLLLQIATLLTLPSTRSRRTPGDRPLSSHCPLPLTPFSWRWPLSSHCPLPTQSLLLEIAHSPHIALYPLTPYSWRWPLSSHRLYWTRSLPTPGDGHSPHTALYPLTLYPWR